VLLADSWVEKIALLVEKTTRALEKSKIDKLGPSSRRNSTRTRIEEEEDLTEEYAVRQAELRKGESF
jgi:hypothetical protein